MLVYHNTEHTVVLPGGRSVNPGTLQGNIPSFQKNSAYLVRLVDVSGFKNADLIVLYSFLDFLNVWLSGLFSDELVARMVYVPALPFTFSPSRGSHSRYKVITTIYNLKLNVDDHRGSILLQLIKDAPYLQLENHKFSSFLELESLYDDTMILLNLHQTPHHHTPEELRILPALQLGVVVICEWSPLHHLMPYHEFVVLATRDEIVKKTIDVFHRYSYYHQLIFGGTRLQTKLSEMLNKSQTQLIQTVERWRHAHAQ